MEKIGAYEARTSFAELLADVEKGHRFVITRYNKPIAILSPVLGPDPERIQVVADTLRKNRRGRYLGGNIRDFISEERKW